jgi:hypothetical protein
MPAHEEKATIYSVWLCPSQKTQPELYGLLQQEIKYATGRYGCTAWPPHISLSTEVKGEKSEVFAKVMQIASSIQVCDIALQQQGLARSAAT